MDLNSEMNWSFGVVTVNLSDFNAYRLADSGGGAMYSGMEVVFIDGARDGFSLADQRFSKNQSNYFSKFNEIEFTQCLSSVGVLKPSPLNTCPRCPPQAVQVISTRLPSGSGWRDTAPGMASGS